MMAVYFVRSGLAGDIKIGSSTNPLSRLRTLQTSHPQKLRLIRLLEGGRQAEAALHERFAAYRKAGEWFTYSEEMAAPDLGIADLPIPFPTRKRPPPDTAYNRRAALHEDIFFALGRQNEIGKRLGVAPWEACGWHSIKPKYYSAIVLMMRDAGYKHVTVDVLLELDTICVAASRASSAKHETDRVEKYHAGQQVRWIKKHGRAAAWWLAPDEAAASPEEAEAAA